MTRHPYPFEGTIADLAKRVGVGRVHLSNILSGLVGASLETAARIEDETNGAISIRWIQTRRHTRCRELDKAS